MKTDLLSYVRRMFALCGRMLVEHTISSRQIIPRLIMSRDGKSVYLERYYLLGHPSEEDQPDSPLTVVLHRFRMSDDDGALHNHPWQQSVSFIIAGGYVETRGQRNHSSLRVGRFEPGDFNLIGAEDFHSVALIEDDCWSIFISGSKTGHSWGFIDIATGLYTPWREWIAKLRGIDPSTINDNIKRSEDIR